MVERTHRCIMNTTAFYISLTVYIYINCFSGNTDMKLFSFQSAVLLGIIALLHRR